MHAVTDPAPPAESPRERLTWWGSFADAGIERSFRDHQLADDLGTARICVLVGLAGCLFFIPSDYALFGPTHPFFALLVVRLACALTSVLVVQAFGHRLTPSRLDVTLTVWAFLVAVVNCYVTSTRPPSYSGHLTVNLMLLLLGYCFYPLPLNVQTVLAVPHSLVLLLVTARSGQADVGLWAAAVGGSLLATNLLGAATCRQLNARKRQLYAALQRESCLRTGLERALAEVRTLRGLISICCNCKKVRDDGGDWHQVETYVRKHTHAEFSHGICPGCVEELYGDYLRKHPGRPAVAAPQTEPA